MSLILEIHNHWKEVILDFIKNNPSQWEAIEKMYQTDTISKFDLEDYFNSLSINIIANYAYKKEILSTFNHP